MVAAFERLGKATGMSTGKAMAEFLGDSMEAIEYLAKTVERARAAPKLVMQEMHAYALGLADETGEVLKRVRAGQGVGEQGDAQRPLISAPWTPKTAPTPPVSNTGGKPQKTHTPKTRGKRS